MNFPKSLLSISVIVIICYQHSYAENEVSTIVNKKKQVIELDTIVVTALAENVGHSVYDAEKLENMPTTNKTISEFLKINPNVQFNNASQAAGTAGELSVEDISINGGLFYQNKFLLDNVNIGNMINPAAGDNSNAFNAVSGRSQAVTLNTDLLCSLEVLDSNVSAEYGEFTGGVVKATTCAPTTQVGKIHGLINYDYTSSDWSKYNYANNDELALFENNTNANYQKDFVKQGVSASMYGNVTNQLGLSLSASRRQSDIDLTSALNDRRSYNQERTVDNIDLGVYYQFNDQHSAKLKFVHTNDQAKKYQANSLDSKSEQSNINDSIDLEFKHQFNSALVTQSFVYQEMDIQRETNNTQTIAWRPSLDKNWSTSTVASEGGAGALEHQLKSFEYNVKSVFDPLFLARTVHQFILGTGYGYDDANWYRPTDFYSYFVPSGTGLGVVTCTRDDGSIDQYCDLSYSAANRTGQAHIRRVVFESGEIDIQQDRWHAFLEDNINWNNTIKARLGVRVDYDSLTKNNNFAPRTKIDYLPFADERLVFTTGWNRYYARNSFDLALQDGINSLSYNETRANINQNWAYSSPYLATNVARTQLDTPFTDETVFAISGRQSWFDWQLKYVNRQDEDQIRKQRVSLSPTVFEYTNEGLGKSDTYSLILQNHRPIKLLSTNNQLYFAANYTDVTRNFNNYDDSMLNEDIYILYNGKVIGNIDRPATNFNQPWTLRFGWNTHFENIPLRVSQLLRYRGSHNAMISSSIPAAERFQYNGEIVDTQYNPERVKAAFTWDIKASYDFAIAKDYLATIGLTINNVTNQKNEYLNQTYDRLDSEIGRQFIADISFKF